MPDTETTSPETRQGVAFVLAVILFMLVLAAYWPVRGHGFAPFDDAEYVTANPRVLAGLTPGGAHWAFTTGHAANWHPITWLSHMVDCSLFGTHAGSHHMVNVFLHGLNAGVLLIVLTALLRTVWASLAAAVLFALHPANVEAVVWVSQRKTLLSTLFLLLAIWAWNSYGRKRAAWSYGSALGCFALALLAKPAVVTLPFLLLLLDAWPLRRATTAREWTALVVEKIPFFLLSAAVSVVTLLVQGQGHAMEGMAGLPFVLRAGNAVWSLGRYLVMFVWPFRLAVFYPHPGENLPWGLVALSATVVLALTALALWSMRNLPVVAVGWCWFLGTLVPVLGLVQVGLQAMADRYVYLPFIGLCLVAGWFTAGLHLKFKVRPSWVGAAFTLLAAGLMFATQAQVGIWRDGETLYRRALAVTPDNALVRNNLGVVLLREGDAAAALAEFDRALALDPDDPNAMHNRGDTLATLGDIESAAVSYRAALERDPGRPDSALALGNILMRAGDAAEAASMYRRGLERLPGDPSLLKNLGTALMLSGQQREALAALREAAVARPDDAEVWFTMGASSLYMLDPTRAEGYFREAVRLRPDLAERVEGAWENYRAGQEWLESGHGIR